MNFVLGIFNCLLNCILNCPMQSIAGLVPAKHGTMIDHSGKFPIPLTQTSAAHLFLFFLFLTNIDTEFQISVSQKLIFIRPKHDIFQKSPIYLKNCKCYSNYFWSVTEVDRIYLAGNSELFLFQKWYKHIGIYKYLRLRPCRRPPWMQEAAGWLAATFGIFYI